MIAYQQTRPNYTRTLEGQASRLEPWAEYVEVAVWAQKSCSKTREKTKTKLSLNPDLKRGGHLDPLRQVRVWPEVSYQIELADRFSVLNEPEWSWLEQF